jgi:hypothetical protein
MGAVEMSAVVQGSSPFNALLVQCRDLASRELAQAIDTMLEGADAALSELAVKTQDREVQKVYASAKDLVQTKRAEFGDQFHQRYLSEFNHRSNKARKIGGNFADFEVTSGGLSLVADDDLEESLKFNEMAARLRRMCEDEMNALDQRVGVLLGDAELAAEDNPIGAQAVLDSYKQACRKVSDSVELRAVLLRLFEDLAAEKVRDVYKALNDLLVQNGILPKIRFGAPKKNPAKKRKIKYEDGDETEVDESSAEDMFSALKKLLGGAGGGAGTGTGVGGAPLLQGAELLGSLTQLQLDGLAALGAGAKLPEGGAAGTANILHELKTSSVGASMGQMDAVTLDIVARLFDQLFDDPNIPLGAKGLIGRLQIPMLKVAIADKELFSKKDHPARTLLDTLGEIAIRLPADFNTDSSLYGHLEAILQELISGYKDDVGIFTTVRESLVALMRKQDERIEAEAREKAQHVIQEEALAVAKAAAQAVVAERVQAHPLPGPVLEFIIEQWLKLMMLIHVRRGPDSDPWNRAIAVMDDLIWSVQPKESAEDRRKLAALVPGLVKSLGAGMEAAGLEHEVRELFFGELMKQHTRIMTAPKDAPPAAPKAPAAAPDFTKNISIRNPFGAGEVQVGAVEADLGKEGGGRWDPTNPDNLAVGDWFEFKEGESRRPVRLIFVTPRKTRFIFCDRGEKDYIECTRSEITRRLRAGEAVIMDETPEVPFFERILGGVLSKMRGAPAAA